MRNLAVERVDRLERRVLKLCDYLRDEAGEFELAGKLFHYMTSASFYMKEVDPDSDNQEYLQSLYKAMMGLMKLQRMLQITYDRELLEDRTLISMKRECIDLNAIMLRKAVSTVEDAGLWDEI